MVKTLILLGSLALCALVLVFAGEEAQAQQRDVAIDVRVTGKISETPVETTPTEEESPRETRPPKASPVDPVPRPPTGHASEPPAGQPAQTAAPNPALAEPELAIGPALPAPDPVPGPVLQPYPVSGSVTIPAEQDGAEAPVDPDLGPPASGSTSPEPVPTPEPAPVPLGPDRSPLDPGPEPVEESEPLPLLAGEASAAPAVPDSGEEEASYPLYSLVTPVVGAVEPLEEALESATANALGTLSWHAPQEGEGLIDTALAGLFSGGEPGRTPASEPGGGARSSPTGPESPLKDGVPQLVSPFKPSAGSSFSLSGGQMGSGGVVLLLLCVLASSLILLRRDFKLLWASCEQLPKPSSALLLPRERPG